MKKIITIILTMSLILAMVGCEYEVSGSVADIGNTQNAANTLQGNQLTPTDIEYSLERYNLIRRAYWVNGQREKAAAVVCPVEKPLGYVILFTESGAVVGNVLTNSYVWNGNVPKDIDSELPYLQ